MQWQRYLVFPDDVHLSIEAEDLIRRYVTRCIGFRVLYHLTLALWQTTHFGRAKVECRSYQKPPFLLWGRLGHYQAH